MIPQHDEQAELAILGACMIEVEAIQLARQFVEPAHFFASQRGAIFETVLRLHDKGESVDVITLAAELERQGKLDSIGGRSFLADCFTSTHASHTASYSRLVARHYYDREIAKQARRLAENTDSETLERISALCIARSELDSPAVFDYQTSLHDALDDISSSKKEPVYKFGLPALDAITDGLKKGEVTTFGAATNQGKSLLLLNLMDLQARAGARCLFVGSEMTAQETFARHLSMRSGLEAWKVRLHKLGPDEIRRAVDTVSEHLSPLPIQILDDPEPSLERIEAAILRTKPDAVFVDYLQRMSFPHAKDFRLAVNEFMRRLKGIARKRQCLIFLASQLNRTTYSKESDLPPTLADLSESSAIEKESDRVFLLWRPKILQPQADPGTANYRSRIEVIKAKDRHGPNGLKAHLDLDGKVLTIKEASL